MSYSEAEFNAQCEYLRGLIREQQERAEKAETRITDVAQPTPEAVAWRVKNDHGHWYVTQHKDLADTWRDFEGYEVQDLYVAQPPAAPVTDTASRIDRDYTHSRLSAGRETELLATLVYEAMRFAIWAAGQGMMPDEGEPALGPEDFLYEYSCALEIDDWEGLAEVARDHIRAVPQGARK